MSEDVKNSNEYLLGEVAYNAYCGSKDINWTSYKGDKLPEFKDNLPRIQRAWIESAQETKAIVLSHVVDNLLANGDTEKSMQNLASFLSSVLGDLGFALFTFEFNKASHANYISNAQRETMIKAIKETLVRFENQEVVNKIQGFKK